MLFGSYFGDWDSSSNLMRGALASDGGALTCGWAGRPHWYLHPMAMGATVGDCLMLTQNNGKDGYQPTGAFPRGVSSVDAVAIDVLTSSVSILRRRSSSESLRSNAMT